MRLAFKEFLRWVHFHSSSSSSWAANAFCLVGRCRCSRAVVGRRGLQLCSGCGFLWAAVGCCGCTCLNAIIREPSGAAATHHCTAMLTRVEVTHATGALLHNVTWCNTCYWCTWCTCHQSAIHATAMKTTQALHTVQLCTTLHNVAHCAMGKLSEPWLPQSTTLKIPCSWQGRERKQLVQCTFFKV